MREFHRLALGKGVHFTSCIRPKYKINRMSIYFVLPLRKNEASANAVLSCLFTKSCRKFPTITAFSDEMGRLYGADLYGNVHKIEGNQVLSFTVEVIDDSYALTPEDLTRQAAELLCDAVLDPLLDETGNFPEESFRLEQQMLLDTVLSEQNNKRSYALAQFRRVMFAGEDGSLSKLGEAEDIRNLTVKDAKEAWLRMLSSAKIEITFTGSGHEEEAKAVFARRFGELSRDKIYRLRRSGHKMPVEVKRVTEQMPVKQAKLVVGYALGPAREQRVALKVLSCILGSSPSSRFFVNIREKESLCYYCAARSSAYQGVMIADCGVEKENVARAENAIQREIDSIAADGCSKEELEIALRYLATAYRSASDSVSTMDWWNFTRILQGGGTLAHEFSLLQQVDPEEIRQLAGKLKKDTVYLLCMEGGEEQVEDDQA